MCTAVLFGVIYGDSGSNASKSVQNLSLLCACNIYVWYTSVLPSVLKCECRGHGPDRSGWF